MVEHLFGLRVTDLYWHGPKGITPRFARRIPGGTAPLQNAWQNPKPSSPPRELPLLTFLPGFPARFSTKNNHTIMNSRPVLYTKVGCPWCAEAREVLERRGIAYDERSVTADADAFAKMLRLSGQMKAPVLDWSDEILADFGTAELELFLATRALPGKVRL